MKKILFILFLGFCFLAHAQDLQLFVAVNKNPALYGEQIRVEFSIAAKGENFRGPNFKDFKILGGPNPSTSSSYTFVNGKSKSQTTTTYSYFLQAKKVGDLTISSATINVKGKQYTSNAVKIKIVKNNSQKNNNRKNKNAKTINNKQLYLTATVNKTKIYQGQQISVIYKLFTRVDLASTEFSKNPSLNGFWTEDLKVSSKFKREIIDGIPYNVAIVKKALLTAQKSGDLKIDQMKIKTQVRVQNNNKRSNHFDPFGMFNQYSTVEKVLSSNPINIKVEPLPSPKPIHFYGGVGKLKIKVEVDNKSVKANEAINMKITLSGNGNLALLKPFKIDFPPDFEVYDPKIIDKTFSTNTQTNGKKIFEYLLIPRFEGNYEIPAISYDYFNPSTKKYQTIRTNKIPITVLKGDTEESGISNVTNKEDVKLLNTDIRYIKTQTNLEEKGAYFYQSKLFWMLFITPILLFLSLLIYLKIMGKNDTNSIYNKSRKATKYAQKRLKTAQKHLNNDEKELFFEEIEKSLWGYFADKFSVEVARLSKDSVRQYFEKFNIKEQTQNQFISLLGDCEMARYAPSTMQNTKMEELLKSAQEIIIEVESQKK
ncbi:MAG: protein BatD [Flavobacteriales bacterium]|nr:protein BatD [Flavobacteriales bacterium]